MLQLVGGKKTEEGGFVGECRKLLPGLPGVTAGGQRAGAEVLPLAVLLLVGGHRLDRGQTRRPVHACQCHPYTPFAGAVALRGRRQRDQARECAVIEVGGMEQGQRMQDLVTLLLAETEMGLQLLPEAVRAA